MCIHVMKNIPDILFINLFFASFRVEDMFLASVSTQQRNYKKQLRKFRVYKRCLMSVLSIAMKSFLSTAHCPSHTTPGVRPGRLGYISKLLELCCDLSQHFFQYSMKAYM